MLHRLNDPLIRILQRVTECAQKDTILFFYNTALSDTELNEI